MPEEPAKLTKYVIHDRSEETECDQCGCPLYVGDKALEKPDGAVYCSEQCSRVVALRQAIR